MNILEKTSGVTGLLLDILKMESWMHMGHAAIIVIKDIIHIFASICKNVYFADGMALFQELRYNGTILYWVSIVSPKSGILSTFIS